jgi:hypothetical protein
VRAVPSSQRACENVIRELSGGYRRLPDAASASDLISGIQKVFVSISQRGIPSIIISEQERAPGILVTKSKILILSLLVLLGMGIGFGIKQSLEQTWKFGSATVGQCWTGPASVVDSITPVDLKLTNCSSPHSNETIAVTKLPSTVSDFPTRESDALLTLEQALAIHNAVVKPILGTLDRGGLLSTRLVTWGYPPTLEQWNKGARWLRIDFFVLDTGWPQSFIEPVLKIKGKIRDLVAAAKKNPALIDYCVDTASNDQLPTVNAAKLILSNCTQNPRWHLEAVTNLVKGTMENFPGSAEVAARAKAACMGFLKSNIYRMAYTDQNGTEVSKANWNRKYTPSVCWISTRP